MKTTIKDLAKEFNSKLPTKKTEAYRYFDIEAVLEKEYEVTDKNKQDIKKEKKNEKRN